MLEIYGIKNCNTVKKALDWLAANDINYTFHDYKKEPVSLAKLQAWEQVVSWESLVNKKGTTWRKLTDEVKEGVVDAASANQVMLANNSMIKRPLIETADGIILGFDESEYKHKLR